MRCWPWVREERLTAALRMVVYLRERNIILNRQVAGLKVALEGFRPMAELLDRAMSERGPEKPQDQSEAKGVSEDPESASDDSETSQAPYVGPRPVPGFNW